jgi:hypothetical protein
VLRRGGRLGVVLLPPIVSSRRRAINDHHADDSREGTRLVAIRVELEVFDPPALLVKGIVLPILGAATACLGAWPLSCLDMALEGSVSEHPSGQ